MPYFKGGDVIPYYLIIFTTNLNKENYKKIIPSPLLSRFTMKHIFEPLSLEVKNKYINDIADIYVLKDKKDELIEIAQSISSVPTLK